MSEDFEFFRRLVCNMLRLGGAGAGCVGDARESVGDAIVKGDAGDDSTAVVMNFVSNNSKEIGEELVTR